MPTPLKNLQAQRWTTARAFTLPESWHDWRLTCKDAPNVCITAPLVAVTFRTVLPSSKLPHYVHQLYACRVHIMETSHVLFAERRCGSAGCCRVVLCCVVLCCVVSVGLAVLWTSSPLLDVPSYLPHTVHGCNSRCIGVVCPSTVHTLHRVQYFTSLCTKYSYRQSRVSRQRLTDSTVW